MLPPDEKMLVQSYHRGDRAAGQQLVKLHYRAVYCFFRGNFAAHIAEDLTQATFEVLLSRTVQFRGESSLRTFLLGIARNKLFQFLRTQKRESKRFDPARDSLLALAVDPKNPSPSAWLAHRKQEGIVVQALRSLPVDDQVLLELKTFERLKAHELATIFDVPAGTIASRLSRARQRLRREVEKLVRHPSKLDSTLRNLESLMLEIRANLNSAIRRRIGLK